MGATTVDVIHKGKIIGSSRLDGHSHPYLSPELSHAGTAVVDLKRSYSGKLVTVRTNLFGIYNTGDGNSPNIPRYLDRKVRLK